MSAVYNVCIDKFMVFNLLCGSNKRKNPCPDGTEGQVLTNCAPQLADIFCFIFQLSSELHKVPRLQKNSIIVPVPKNKIPKTVDEFKPVALTSLVMKIFEKLVKSVQNKLDLL